MFILKYLQILTFSFISIVIIDCAPGPPPPEPEPEPPEPPPFVDACAAGANDNVIEVPAAKDLPSNQKIIRISTQDTYWYGAYHLHHKGCDRFVVDVKINVHSNETVDPDGSSTWGDITLFADAYNLPSSDGWFHDGTVPHTVRDCNAYEMHVRYYEKLAGATSFTFLEEKTFGGEWSEGTCKIIPLPAASGITQSGEFKSEEWDTYRVAVKVLLRGLPQQARVIVDAKPPKAP